jgi:hypothetical protein
LSAKKKDGFFSRPQLVGAGWGVLLLILAFVGGKTYDRIFGEEPQRVVVDNMPPPPAVVPIIRATAELDEDSKKQIRLMIAEMQAAARRERKISQSSSSEDERAAANRRIAELEGKVAALQMAKISVPTDTVEKRPMPPSNVSFEIVIDKWPYKPYASVIRPQSTPDQSDGYNLPSSKDGYLLQKTPTLLRNLKCPAPKTIAPDSQIQLSFSVATAAQLARMSPVWLSVVRKEEGDKRVQYFSQYVPVTVGDNTIELQANFLSGGHELTVGYYLKDQVTGKYPTLYALVCELDVSPASPLTLSVN